VGGKNKKAKTAKKSFFAFCFLPLSSTVGRRKAKKTQKFFFAILFFLVHSGAQKSKS
jgi:hypothetical protein